MSTGKTSGTWAPMPPPRNRAWEEASRGKNLDRPRPYRTDETYALGQVIAHEKFGVGIVVGLKEGRKMIVVFPQAMRILLHGAK